MMETVISPDSSIIDPNTKYTPLSLQCKEKDSLLWLYRCINITKADFWLGLSSDLDSIPVL